MSLEKFLGKIGKEADLLIGKATETSKEISSSDYVKNLKEAAEGIEKVFKSKLEKTEEENEYLKTFKFKNVMTINLKKDFPLGVKDFSWSVIKNDTNNEIAILSIVVIGQNAYETYSFEIDTAMFDYQLVTIYSESLEEIFIEIPKKKFLV